MTATTFGVFSTLYSRKAGEIVINAKTAAIDLDKSSNIEFLIRKTVEENNKEPKKRNTAKKIELSDLKNTILAGNSVNTIKHLPDESVNLVFTSPPYYNAKPEYSEYHTYDEYLELMRKVIKES
jgi:hypothetical protein